MKLIIALFIALNSMSVFAWEAQEKWNAQLGQELVLNCDGRVEGLCSAVCDDPLQCYVPAGPCRSCIGTGVFLSFFYQEVGRWFVNSGELLPESYLLERSLKQDFVLLTYDSPYNIFSSPNDPGMERAFGALCPGGMDAFPVVIGRKNIKNELARVEAVICHEQNGGVIYGMKSTPNLEKRLREWAHHAGLM